MMQTGWHHRTHLSGGATRCDSFYKPADAVTVVDDGNDVNGTATTSTLPSAGNIHFLQLNLQHSKTASAVLQRQIAALEYAVILVQEPWTVNNNVAGLRTQYVSIYC